MSTQSVRCLEVLANPDSIFLGGQAKELEKISDTFISTHIVKVVNYLFLHVSLVMDDTTVYNSHESDLYELLLRHDHQSAPWAVICVVWMVGLMSSGTEPAIYQFQTFINYNVIYL